MLSIQIPIKQSKSLNSRDFRCPRQAYFLGSHWRRRIKQESEALLNPLFLVWMVCHDQATTESESESNMVKTAMYKQRRWVALVAERGIFQQSLARAGTT
jgi:hypothetical protein